jgi:hypothetical protein
MGYSKPLGGLCVATALFVCAPDTAAPIPPAVVPSADGSLAVNGLASAVTAEPGATVMVTGTGFADDANITVAVYSTPQTLAELVADDQGAFAVSVQLPAQLNGQHTLVALGLAPDGEPRSLAVPVFISPEAGDGEVPATGTNLGLLLGAGTMLTVAGLAVLRASYVRRRRSA